MKKLIPFIAGTVVSIILCSAAFFIAFIYAVISVIVNGGHPWPYNVLILFGVIPFSVFIIYSTVAVLLMKSVPTSKEWIKKIGFYLGYLCGSLGFFAFLGLTAIIA